MRQKLRADPRTTGIPVLVLTAQATSHELLEALGPDTPVISKALLTRERLTSAIEMLCSPPESR